MSPTGSSDCAFLHNGAMESSGLKRFKAQLTLGPSLRPWPPGPLLADGSVPCCCPSLQEPIQTLHSFHSDACIALHCSQLLLCHAVSLGAGQLIEEMWRGGNGLVGGWVTEQH
ncbi:hypothetical protein E1301_Tti005795 [Triplophysa tibetana]|uniref:Uncharacterized protein n=1 Tax=Triplophysa tibetana TaxID=1572043 RepID=A0A5A9NEX5_9TELE|nr:hypothetical protein E1301_Tti005795 [Triplophysa tibetana]